MNESHMCILSTVGKQSTTIPILFCWGAISLAHANADDLVIPIQARPSGICSELIFCLPGHTLSRFPFDCYERLSAQKSLSHSHMAFPFYSNIKRARIATVQYFSWVATDKANTLCPFVIIVLPRCARETQILLAVTTKYSIHSAFLFSIMFKRLLHILSIVTLKIHWTFDSGIHTV